MDNAQQSQELSWHSIHFHNGHTAQALVVSPDIDAQAILRACMVPRPHALLLICGGAMEIPAHMYAGMAHLLTRGIVRAVVEMGALIIDGGTRAGVMEMVGLSVAEHGYAAMVLGVSPEALVTHPALPTHAATSTDILLDPNHSHFVLVETDTWGGETTTMYNLAAALALECPSVAVLINGGPIARDEVLYNVRQGRPIIIIEGSGRLADELAAQWRIASASGTYAAINEEILRDGHIYVFSIDGSADAFEQLIIRLWQESVPK